MVVIAAHSFSRWSPLKTLQSRNHVHHNHIYYLTSPPMSRDWLTRLDFNTLALPRPGQRRLYRGTSTNYELEVNMFFYCHERWAHDMCVFHRTVEL
jgi:hypothetical protein